MTSHLFLYGTLLPELAPDSVRRHLLRLEPVGSGYVSGRLYDLGSYPGVVLDRQPGTHVRGELFRLPGETDEDQNEIVSALDHYEDAVASDERSGLFVRRCEQIRTVGQGEVAAWIYLYNRDPGGATLIPHGDYRRWLKERK